MSTTSTVCRGLQSCLEPLLLEPRVLMHQLQLLPSKQSLFSENPTIDITLMQSMTNPSTHLRKNMEEPDKAYVHPLAKRSSHCLSSKSLEMCTESLGSETGSIIDSSMDQSTHQLHQKQTKSREEIKKVRQSSSFPPPLTSIRGSQGVHVQTHREGGRLVIKAFSFSLSSTLFQTERRDGRLRLSLLKAGERERENHQNEEEEEDCVDEDCDEHSEDEDDLKRGFKAEDLKSGGGKLGCKIGGGGGGSGGGGGGRCNGDRRKRLPCLQYCVAIS